MRKLKPQRRDNSASVRGRKVVSEILNAARDVLVEEGYPRLTMRNVAERVGMTVGNLSYYFPSKEALLHDLLEAVIQGYVEDFDRITERSQATPADQLEELIRFLMRDLGTKETTGFFPELWALAAHDEVAAAEMEKVYAIERGVIEKIIGRMRPDLPPADRVVLALYVSATIEGHTMFIGYRRAMAAQAAASVNVATAALVELVRSISSQTIRGFRRSKGLVRRAAE